ncbi:hypothetical protein JCM10207_007199 [Rhodosporidiobolus poonsookiae]
MNGHAPASTAPGAGEQRKRVALADTAALPALPAVAPSRAGEGEPPSKKQRLGKVKEDESVKEEEEDDRPEDEVRLENFRKEALYRELTSYKRQLARAQADAERLRAERAACDARLSRVDSAWREVRDEAERVTGGRVGQGDREDSPPLTDPALDDAALSAALSFRTSTTKALLSRLSSLPSSSASSPTDLESKCRSLLLQASESREALRLVRAEHALALEDLERVNAALVRAEKRFDRWNSRTVAAVEGRVAPRDLVAAAAAAAAGASPTPAPQAPSPLPNGALRDEGDGPVASTSAGPSDPGGVALLLPTAELDELRALVESRAREIDGLRAERVQLKLEVDQMKGKFVDLPDDLIAETAPFRLMQQHVQYLAAEYDTKRVEAERAVKEAEELKEGMSEFRDGVVRDATSQVTDLQTRLTSREGDLTRLRAARDDLKAEASELLAKETDRSKALDELRTLAEARKARLAAYASEVRRLRIGKAAEEGKRDEVDARVRLAEQVAAAGGEEDDGAEEGEVEDDLVADLQARVVKAEALLLALRDQLTHYAAAAASAGGGVPSAQQLVESETRAREDLHRAKTRLEKLERLCGTEADPGTRELVEKLREKEDEVKRAEAKVKSGEAATNMLYGEIDRMSTAWAALDEQNASKVFNLASLEDKIQRLNADKAKADNRYFGTMRQKDALANENAVLTKLAEKQQQKVEAANEIQRSIAQQLTSAEKEISLHQKNVRAYQDNLAQLKRDNAELTLRSDKNAQHLVELNAALSERITQAETECALRSKADERAAKLERQLQTAQEKADAAKAPASSGGGGADPAEVRELKRYNADLSQMLKCSTCSLRLKEVVLTRCGHAYCRPCVDDRLANRLRRCAQCQTGFGAQDCITIYF